MSPAKESYEIGSQVMLNCIATPLPQKYYRNFTFPMTYYQWSSSGEWPLNSGSLISIKTWSYQQGVVEYYCLVYRHRNGLLLGKGRTTLAIEGDNYYACGSVARKL